jgi:hypothetical protein
VCDSLRFSAMADGDAKAPKQAFRRLSMESRLSGEAVEAGHPPGGPFRPVLAGLPCERRWRCVANGPESDGTYDEARVRWCAASPASYGRRRRSEAQPPDKKIAGSP